MLQVPIERRLWAAGLAAALLLAGCGGSAAVQPTTAPKPPAVTAKPAAPSPQHVTLRLDWLAAPYDVPYVVARDKGFYRAQGLDVSIGQGKGSVTTSEVVGKGDDTFGVADAGTAALTISRGVTIKVIGDFIQQSPYAVMFHKGVTINSPADLKGKEIIEGPGSSILLLLPAVLAKASLTMSDVHWDSVSPSSKYGVFMSKPQGIMLGFSVNDYEALKKLDPDVQERTYADFGLHIYSTGVITSLNEISSHPDQVKAFMAATDQGWQYAIAHPDESAADLVAAFPNLNEQAVKADLPLVFASLHTQATKGHPIGWMSGSDWQDTIQIWHEYGKLQNVKPTADYYTDEFIPQS